MKQSQTLFPMGFLFYSGDQSSGAAGDRCWQVQAAPGVSTERQQGLVSGRFFEEQSDGQAQQAETQEDKGEQEGHGLTIIRPDGFCKEMYLTVRVFGPMIGNTISRIYTFY